MTAKFVNFFDILTVFAVKVWYAAVSVLIYSGL